MVASIDPMAGSSYADLKTVFRDCMSRRYSGRSPAFPFFFPQRLGRTTPVTPAGTIYRRIEAINPFSSTKIH
jgi:hypothetical protein